MEKGLREGCSKVAAMAASMLVLLVVLQLAVQSSAVCPPRGSVKIQSFSYGGSGCPPGSAEGIVSEDARAVTLIFSNYIATTDGSLADRKKTCTVSVGLSYPPGWIVGVASVTLRGYAKLEHGTTGSIQTWYFFSGHTQTARVVRNLPAPFDKNFEYTDTLLTSVYSHCGVVRNLNLASEAKVHPGRNRKQAFINIDSKDFSLGQEWRLVWKKC